MFHLGKGDWVLTVDGPAKICQVHLTRGCYEVVHPFLIPGLALAANPFGRKIGFIAMGEVYPIDSNMSRKTAKAQTKALQRIKQRSYQWPPMLQGLAHLLATQPSASVGHYLQQYDMDARAALALAEIVRRGYVSYETLWGAVWRLEFNLALDKPADVGAAIRHTLDTHFPKQK